MRRTLAAAFLVLATATAPAVADDPLDWLDECMDCIPGRCQILNSCELWP